jgi:hypothetical protein
MPALAVAVIRPDFDADLLPASLRSLVKDIAGRMQVPLDFLAVVDVATLSGLCGRRALIQPKKHDSSWLVVPNIWVAIIMASAFSAS